MDFNNDYYYYCLVNDRGYSTSLHVKTYLHMNYKKPILWLHCRKYSLSFLMHLQTLPQLISPFTLMLWLSCPAECNSTCLVSLFIEGANWISVVASLPLPLLFPMEFLLDLSLSTSIFHLPALKKIASSKLMVLSSPLLLFLWTTPLLQICHIIRHSVLDGQEFSKTKPFEHNSRTTADYDFQN